MFKKIIMCIKRINFKLLNDEKNVIAIAIGMDLVILRDILFGCIL